jgi:hypothetical protein
MDFVDLHLGVGLSQAKWWINDVDILATGNARTRLTQPERSSWETGFPVFGFFGMDFVLPRAYRLTVQAGIRSLENGEVGIALSQGLERD